MDYDKLVRDKIPKIIKQQKRRPIVRETKDKEEFRTYLAKKLVEEATEYEQSQSLEELADILEVMISLLAEHKSSLDKLEAIRKQKRSERGGFDKKLILISVEE